MRKNNKRSVILDAALDVVEDKGARHLTIDAVAARSGVSKGGVLYHFASKQALLAGMMQHLLDLMEGRISESRSGEAGDNALLASLHAREAMSAAELRASQALLAAAAEDTELLQPARDRFAAVFNEAVSGCEDELAATVLLLASEGLRFLDILDISPLDRNKTDAVVAYMHEQAEALK